MDPDAPRKHQPGFLSTHLIYQPGHRTTARFVMVGLLICQVDLMECQATTGQAPMVIHPLHNIQQYRLPLVRVQANMT